MKPTIALILNTYNQPDYLARVLAAVSNQTQLPEEVLLADDGSGHETREVFTRWKLGHTVCAEHVWQQNEGFRRSRILNQAVVRARSDYLVFLDADTLPHPCFIADHHALASQGWFVQGHRALIEKKAAASFGLKDLRRDRWRALLQRQLRGVKNAYRWPGPLKRRPVDLRGIRGSNLAIWRADLIRVNGYNEDFVGWGREDSELAVRLINCGVRRLDVRGWAVCYHLWHPSATRTSLGANDNLLAQAQRERAARCALGLDQYLMEKPA